MEPLCTIREFQKLSNYQKYGLLEDHGTYLEVSRPAFPMIKIALYELFGFYVEVYLDQKADRIVKASAFTDYAKLDQYIQDIDISPAFELL